MSEWISVDDRLPESQKDVLAYYVNKYGEGKTVKAEYVASFSALACDFYDEESDYESDYSEIEDAYYVKEGWHERVENWKYSGCEIVEGQVTHWMPLPEPPKEKNK